MNSYWSVDGSVTLLSTKEGRASASTKVGKKKMVISAKGTKRELVDPVVRVRLGEKGDDRFPSSTGIPGDFDDSDNPFGKDWQVRDKKGFFLLRLPEPHTH
jgi:hypothetical protein